MYTMACVSRKWLFYRISGALVILSGIVKQCEIYCLEKSPDKKRFLLYVFQSAILKS